MSESRIVYEKTGRIVTITLNRPESRNTVSEPETIEELVAALERLNNDDATVAILTGAGPAFSSGGNVKKMAGSTGPINRAPADNRRHYLRGIQRIPLAFQALEVPVIAAVNGPAIGAGCDLACMCDIRIAAESASFAESFIKLGIIPGDGGAWFLPRVVGYSKACELAFTGDPVDAQEALAIGLVSKVVPDAELLPTALSMAGCIARNPAQAIRMTKRLLHEGRHATLNALLELSAAMQAIAHTTPDHKEALDAVMEKRKPDFGRV